MLTILWMDFSLDPMLRFMFWLHRLVKLYIWGAFLQTRRLGLIDIASLDLIPHCAHVALCHQAWHPLLHTSALLRSGSCCCGRLGECMGVAGMG